MNKLLESSLVFFAISWDDLAKYVENWDFEFDYKTKPFTVIQQQVLVLPPDSFNILPNKSLFLKSQVTKGFHDY